MKNTYTQYYFYVFFMKLETYKQFGQNVVPA